MGVVVLYSYSNAPFCLEGKYIGDSVLVAYWIPTAFLIHTGGEMFAILGIVSEQYSHIGVLWNLNLGKVLYL